MSPPLNGELHGEMPGIATMDLTPGARTAKSAS